MLASTAATMRSHREAWTVNAPRAAAPIRALIACRTIARARITSKLPALHFYQLSIPAPKPAHGSFDAAAGRRGRAVFNGPARCSSCRVPPIFTEPGWNMHTPAEIGIDDFQSSRSPDQRYRTAPLGGLFTRLKGVLYHDGHFGSSRPGG